MLSGAGGAPLVAYLHGPGGIGKSSLVRYAAWRAELAGRRVVQVDARFLDADTRRLEETAAPACAEPGAVLLHDRRTARAASRGSGERLPYLVVRLVARGTRDFPAGTGRHRRLLLPRIRGTARRFRALPHPP
ncbi:hypothetical protein [Streptomyces antimycoticus]|uniref:hypothetical protein n=1 Tax=Streptomyces antimycoticus TaxID=68175 RepID=UPI0031EB9FDC